MGTGEILRINPSWAAAILTWCIWKNFKPFASHKTDQNLPQMDTMDSELNVQAFRNENRPRVSKLAIA
jgi:hypothetical protein